MPVSTVSKERRAELEWIARRAAELDAAGAPLFSDEQIARVAALLPMPPDHVLAAAGVRRAGEPPRVGEPDACQALA